MNNLLIDAAWRKPTERTPVWVMRQAGRYLKEYREIRKKAGDFLTMCRNPDLATEVSIQPYELVGVDAVIMFSDILTPLVGMGLDLVFDGGPKFTNPINSLADVQKLIIPSPEENTPFVGKILDNLSREVGDKVPVIGFAGAPFTLACYAIEGEGSKLFFKTKKFMYQEKVAAAELLQKFTDMTKEYLLYQIQHGAKVIQLFDTWAGLLSPSDFREFCLPYIKQIFDYIHQNSDVPCIFYINGGAHLTDEMLATGADVIALDWKQNIGKVKKELNGKVAMQGNLDPAVLFADEKTIRAKTREILDVFQGEAGHIFNLGHGIDKEVDPDNLRIMIDEVKNYRA